MLPIMGRFTFFAWIFLILVLLVPGTTGFFQNSSQYPQLSVDTLQHHEVIPGGNHINTFPPVERSYIDQLLPLETDNGRVYHQLASFASPVICFLGAIDSTKLVLKMRALIIPGMNSRTLIFPFHSFF